MTVAFPGTHAGKTIGYEEYLHNVLQLLPLKFGLCSPCHLSKKTHVRIKLSGVILLLGGIWRQKDANSSNMLPENCFIIVNYQ
jgi:hypothetical protein